MDKKYMYVDVETSPVRSNPWYSAYVEQMLGFDSKVEVLGYSEDYSYIHVRTQNGVAGWIHKMDLRGD